MAMSFRSGRGVDASGFPLALINIPQMTPENAISLVDTSYLAEENISSSNTSIVQGYVNFSDGLTPGFNSTGVMVTNITVPISTDIPPAPLYYRYTCRFYHYSYGDNPLKHVYITDQYENVLKGINYLVQAERVAKYVYKIHIVTDFLNGPSVMYKVKYNRCNISGGDIHPSWVENLNATALFKSGFPALHLYEYYLLGPDGNGMYTATVPVVPTLSQLTNSVGVSFENAPTLVDYNLANTAEYSAGVTVRYTLKALSSSTYSIQRNYTRTGVVSTAYLLSDINDSWGAYGPNAIRSTGTHVTGIPGVSLYVHPDSLLIPNDQAYFTASRSYYYVKLVSNKAIYLEKPLHASADDDWYVQVKNGKFTRRINNLGVAVPSGDPTGTTWQYSIPEYQTLVWDPNYGQPYVDVVNERATVVDQQTIQLSQTPLFIDPSSVLLNPINPGFPPSGFIMVSIAGENIPQSSFVDWDLNNGTVKLDNTLSIRDDIRATYVHEEPFYEYQGFVGSGGIYPVVDPLPYVELNLNPSLDIGQAMYASGSIASVYIKPYSNASTGAIQNYTTIYHNFTGIPASGVDFKLGEISLGPVCRVSDIQVLDARTRGGGLNDDGINNIDKVIEIEPEAQFFWDTGYFDGQAVPANGALVVKVPKRILASNGGAFTVDEVRQRVYKHVALGCYVILEFV